MIVSNYLPTCVLLQSFIQKLETATGAAIPVKFEGKQYSCCSAVALQTAACNPESLRYIYLYNIYTPPISNDIGFTCRQNAEDHQQQDQVEIDSPVKAPSSAATTPLSPTSPAAGPLRQQSSSGVPRKFQICALELQKSNAFREWKNIVRRLGVEEHEIDRIEAENKQKPTEAFYQTMLHWYNKGEEATSQHLITALEKTRLRKVVDDFKADGYFDW